MKKIIFYILVMMSMASLYACDNGDFSDPKQNESRAHSYSIKIVCDDGDVIYMNDTTVYVIDCDSQESNNNPEIHSTTSISNIETAYGYDSNGVVSDYHAYTFTDASKYGLTPGVYVMRREYFRKNVYVPSNKEIQPVSYSTAPDGIMGWKNGTSIVGYLIYSSSTLETTQMYIKCDISGRSISRYIPSEPNNLVWKYKLSTPEDIEW